ncbi:MAG: ATP-dependent RNA helicase HrpA [Proteobacteria bacterium]|nr:ATP-dependent RNA helicase HrpA [Pseudomonadota bacterium]
MGALRAALAGVMAVDAPRLRVRIDRCERQRAGAGAGAVALARIAAEIERSRRLRDLRAAGKPAFDLPPELPVSARADEIAAAIRAHPVVIVAGETGSGKTTQLPKICLAAGRGERGQIAHTQPRRLAARSVAARVAQELHTEIGGAVGYRVRFAERARREGYVTLMTDGILLAETERDRDLLRYDTIIIDEAHERSLNIDFLLGYLRELVRRRADLRVVITSATLDTERFAHHFAGAAGPAPVIRVSGRGHPVEVRYRPLSGTSDEPDDEEALEDAMAAAAEELWREGPGDILAFLPGEREIRETADVLRAAFTARPWAASVEVLPLYARLAFDVQQRVFAPSRGRRIVLATNVAETSLTVPGIRYVIDSGQARIKRYSTRNRTTQLAIEKISRASADQRAGRCGRLGPGVCVRLYAEDDYAARPTHTDPEIQRSSLAGVILRMAALDLGDPAAFPFVDPPLPRAIADGRRQLEELGALDATGRLTAGGRELARLPLDPRVARIVQAARDRGCLAEALVVASALAVPDPRERPLERAQAADQAQLRFRDARSDFLSLLALWEFFDDALRERLTHRRRVEACRAHFVSFLRLCEWRDVHAQLRQALVEAGWRVDTSLPPTIDAARYEALHRALLAGLLGNVGTRATVQGAAPGQYDGARGLVFRLHPGSGIAKKPPRWVVAAELTQTTRLYARCAALVEPAWIESEAGSLVDREHFEPHWDRARGEVVASERVKLYGLTLCARRPVSFGRIDPALAREVFVREALVGGELGVDAPFLARNRTLIDEVIELEHKARRQDVLVDEEALVALYAARIPQDIATRAAFEHWRRRAEAADPDCLVFTRDELMRHAAELVTEELFPPTLHVAGNDLALRYRFAPGDPRDGVTVVVPLALLNQVDAAALDWLVPGMIRDKLTHHLKALPKAWRQRAAPMAETVTEFLVGEPDRSVPVTEALRAFLGRRLGETPPATCFDARAVPVQWRMNVEAVDADGTEIDSDRDLAALRARLGETLRLSLAASTPAFERSGLVAWDFGTLPESLAIEAAGGRTVAWPAIVDEGESVALTLQDREDAAAALSRRGVARLVALAIGGALRKRLAAASGVAGVALKLRTAMTPERLHEDLAAAVADRAFVGDDPLPRDADAFAALVARARVRLPAVVDSARAVVSEVATEYLSVLRQVDALAPGQRGLAREARAQLDALVYPGFLAATPWEHLRHLPRYLQALQRRLQRVRDHPERDARHAAEVALWWARYVDRAAAERRDDRHSPGLEAFRWMIEELRVSLFAQELRTPVPVSFRRIERAWTALSR